MTTQNIREKIKTSEYDFLRENIHLKNKIILLGVAGSHAYGTDTETSDLDIRGVAAPLKHDLMTGRDMEQFIDESTDTVIYSVKKFISLLANGNPNTIEILGLKKDHYLHINELGQMLIDNRNLFLSRKIINSFGGYACQQLRRLENKSIHDNNQLSKHVQKAINHILDQYPDCNIKPYTEDDKILIDIDLKKYPLHELNVLLDALKSSEQNITAIGKRNKSAMTRKQINKHAMHLVRLYLMSIDILENQQIITYREKDHDLLMSIRNGEYADENDEMKPEFFDIVNDLTLRFEKAKAGTSLPREPDYKKIDGLLYTITDKLLKGDYNP